MNLTTRGEAGPSSNSIENKQPELVAGFRPAWHRPVVAIIDIKRTMGGPGAYFDGPGSTAIDPG